MLCVALALVLPLSGCGGQTSPAAKNAAPAASRPSPGTLTRPEKLATKHLPNAVRVHERVISGGLPDGEAGFAELASLGVKSVVSVDGAQPEVELAAKHGLRYVHLPHGYDGIPDDKAALLAKAVQELPGVVYIHCHHGKHRSPAAAAVACVGAGLIEAEQALPILETAGTSPNYRGLYKSAKEIRPLGADKLAEVPADFPEKAKVEALAEAMVKLEHTHDHVKQLAAHDWKTIPTKPDLDAAHEALLLREHFTEMLRTKEVQAQSAEFMELVKQSEAAALQLEEALAAWTKTGKTTPVPETVAPALATVSQHCADCHKVFRDVPLGEK
jgi:hypothetical protein